MTEHLPIQWLEETDSTQNELARHISLYDNMAVVAARLQTAGRGQRGNTWLAGKGMNLTFSMLLRFGEAPLLPLRAADQFRITKTATLGVAAYLESSGIECRIKWPNDIYVRNRKICGMLIENVLDGNLISHSIVGIGLNVNQREFPPQLLNPTSMSLVTGNEYLVEREMEKLYTFLAASFLKMEDCAFMDEAYGNMLYRKGEFHDFTRCLDGDVFEGKIIGTDESGLLIVENRKGELNKFAFKEISYII